MSFASSLPQSPVVAAMIDRVHHASRHRTMLRRAAAHGTWLEATSWTAFWQDLATQLVDVIVVCPDAIDRHLHREMSRLLEAYPHTQTVLHAPLSPDLAHMVVSLAERGLDDVVIQGYDDSVERFRRIFARPRDRDVVDEFFARVRPAMRDFPPRLRHVLEEAVEHPNHAMTTTSVAHTVELSTRAIHRLMHGAGLGALHPYFRACRVLRAYGYLREHGRTLATVAPTVGFSAAGDLIRETDLLLKRRPLELATVRELTPATVATQLYRWLATEPENPQLSA